MTDRERADLVARKIHGAMAGFEEFGDIRGAMNCLSDALLEFAAQEIGVFNQYPTKGRAAELRSQKRGKDA